MFITADQAREYLADIEKRFEQGRIRQEHNWIRNKSPWSWVNNDADTEYEMTGYQAVGTAASYFEVPNR